MSARIHVLGRNSKSLRQLLQDDKTVADPTIMGALDAAANANAMTIVVPGVSFPLAQVSSVATARSSLRNSSHFLRELILTPERSFLFLSVRCFWR